MQGPLGGTLLPAPATSVSCLRRAQPPNLACPSLLRSPEKEAFKKRAKLQQDNSEETDDNEGEEEEEREESGCEEEEDSGSEESLADSDSDPEEKGACVGQGRWAAGPEKARDAPPGWEALGHMPLRRVGPCLVLRDSGHTRPRTAGHENNNNIDAGVASDAYELGTHRMPGAVLS